jgi:hypothetical protein
MTATPNPYVYPSRDFYDLTKTELLWQVERTEEQPLSKVAETLRPYVTAAFVPPQGVSRAEAVIALFSDPSICYGITPKEQSTPWLQRIESGIAAGKLSFTIFGFPFKIPVPLKTDRTLPDGGELASLLRLAALMANVSQIAGCHAHLTIFAEEGFGSFVGLSKEETQRYFDSLQEMVRSLGLGEHLTILPISGMEKDPAFPATFEKNVSSFLAGLQGGSAEHQKKFEGARLSVYRIMSTRAYTNIAIGEAYSSAPSENISEKGREIRAYLEDALPLSIAQYFSYLKTRDDIGYIEQLVTQPLTLTVSPKEGRLGVFPLRREIDVLPYHGVPFLSKGGNLEIRYLYDLQRLPLKVVKVVVPGFTEGTSAFLYQEV